MKTIIFIGVFFTVFLFPYDLKPQDNLKREIMVVKPYEPVISDAYKISELPEIKDSSKADFNFKYLFASSAFEVLFEPQVIKPANMVGESLSKLYHVSLTGGFGNYITPFVSINVNTERSKKYSFSACAGHLSSHGKTTNDISEKVFAGYLDNYAAIDARRFLNRKTLSARVNFRQHTAYYYGYNTASTYADSVILPFSKDKTQNRPVYDLAARLRLKTDPIDSTNINYLIDFDYRYCDAAYQIKENDLKLLTSVNYFFEKEFIGFDASLNYFITDGIKNNINSAVIEFSPWVGIFNKKWQIRVGLNTFYNDSNARYIPYPKINLHYNVIEYFLIPYFEFSGELISNNYTKILFENFYIKPDLIVKPTDKRYELLLGLRGNFSSRLGYNANISKSDINDMYFFVNDTSYVLHNRFDVVYDDVDLLKGTLELSFKKSEKLNFLLKGSYYSYTLKNEEKPWHCPDFDVTFSTRYQLKDKIIATVDIYGMGTRYARILKKPVNEIQKFPAAVDANIGIEYRYTRLLSAFIKFNNIAGAKYFQWNYYPSQRFNVLAGLTYMF